MLVENKKEKIVRIPKRSDGHPHPLTVRLLELAHLRGVFHSEVDFVRVLAHNLQLDILGVTHASEITYSKNMVWECPFLLRVFNLQMSERDSSTFFNFTFQVPWDLGYRIKIYFHAKRRARVE